MLMIATNNAGDNIMYKPSRILDLLSMESDALNLDAKSFLVFKGSVKRYEKILDYTKYRIGICNYGDHRFYNFWHGLEIKMEAFLKNYYRRLAGYAVYLVSHDMIKQNNEV